MDSVVVVEVYTDDSLAIAGDCDCVDSSASFGEFESLGFLA